MKPLKEYPTPETDAAAYYIHMSPDPNGSGPTVVNDDVSRDLERRLAACREFIRDTARTSSSSRIRREAMQVWTATAPKP